MSRDRLALSEEKPATVGDLWRYSIALRQHQLLSVTSLDLMTTNISFASMAPGTFATAIALNWKT